MLKRILDIIGAFLGLLLLSPVLLLLIHRIGKDVGKPVFFLPTAARDKWDAVRNDQVPLYARRG